MTHNDIVQKLWNLCDVLRDDGINYSDYVNELVQLLFIKMVHENIQAGIIKKQPLPEACRWTDFNSKSSINLINDYKRILRTLATGKDAKAKVVFNNPQINAIYAGAETRIREPLHLKQIIKGLDDIENGIAPVKMGWGIYMKACWKRTQVKPNLVPGNILPLAH